MTGNPWLAALMALFLWWFSTGIILWRVRRADNGGPDDHLWSVLLGLFLLGLGVLGFHQTLDDVSPAGVYIAFLSALAIWGWIELAFLSGVITGPNTSPCPDHAPEWERFVRAFGTIAWHEILLAVTTALMLAIAWHQPNHFGALTFALLFVARISAKLNLFFGVANINTEFLPSTLSHLPSHFRRRADERLLPRLGHGPLLRGRLLAGTPRRRHHAGGGGGLFPADGSDPSRPAGTLVHGASASRPETLALDDRPARAQAQSPAARGTQGDSEWILTPSSQNSSPP